ncbi:hypothetical protein DPMN_048078 [Dreissena polymorpha]|uniref:Uncharacterized protein n=1 Tax=Dreissena polymorpha TaxID=45954 RepID=A0A9D4I228_DREPO|nr:hypothetical protein DPMN_048078 [Dreissena polymorpha]
MKNKPSVTTDIIDLFDKTRDLMHEKYTSLASRANYQKANRDVRKKLKEAKENGFRNSVSSSTKR